MKPRYDTLHIRMPAGFTLLEVLVALMLLGVVATGMLVFTSGTLRFTGLSKAVSTTVEDLADAEGYLADTFRNAKAVFSKLELLDSSGNVVVDCDLALNGNCVAVLTPVQDTSVAAQPIIDYDLSVFSIEPMGSRYASDGLDPGWDGANTLALLEYFVPNICGSGCSTVPGNLTASQRTWTGTLGYLVGGLASIDDKGDLVKFFSQPNTSSLVIDFVAKANAASGQPYVVRRTPVALQVTVRE